MWVLSFWPRIKPWSPALVSWFLTTGPPQKSKCQLFLSWHFHPQTPGWCCSVLPSQPHHWSLIMVISLLLQHLASIGLDGIVEGRPKVGPYVCKNCSDAWLMWKFASTILWIFHWDFQCVSPTQRAPDVILIVSFRLTLEWHRGIITFANKCLRNIPDDSV